MTPLPKRTGNRLLDRLPQSESKALLAHARLASLGHGEEVYQQNGPMSHVFFPVTSVLGVFVLTESGQQVEGTTIGREGMLGLPVFLGLDFHPFPAISEVSGEALRVPVTDFLQAARTGGALEQLLRRYTLYRLRCANQTGACNALHTVEERVSRWLLMAREQAGQDEFILTHKFLSEMLGVRRQTITLTASALQRAGFITYSRGILRVQNRRGLEAASCGCYKVLRTLYDRIMGVDRSHS